jgi:tetratricopeptide (TPR) repeat protein
MLKFKTLERGNIMGQIKNSSFSEETEEEGNNSNGKSGCINVIDFAALKAKEHEKRENTRYKLREAEAMVLGVWNSGSTTEKINTAKRALKISEDCADAYTLLGMTESRSLQEKKDMYEKAVSAGISIIGENNFRALEGHFWSVFDTRPYMRAKWALGDVLLRIGDKAAAAENYKEMLRLNPDDHQGVRYNLLSWLLQEKDYEYLQFLFSEFKEDISAQVRYSEVLYNFKIKNFKEAQIKLLEAVDNNPYVPKYIIGKAKLPAVLPPFIGIGNEFEAQHYVEASLILWKKTKGACKWVSDTLRHNYIEYNI